MALTIKENNGIFLIKGIINAMTVKQFKNHLEFLLHYNNELTINIDDVLSIDVNGMIVLRALNAKALITNKRFVVVGYGCKEIYDDFYLSNVA